MENIRIASSDEAAKAARSRRLANLEDSSRYRGSIERIRSNIRAAGAEEMEADETLPPWEEFLGLKKDSCCCGATIMSPCACMFEGVMDCSAVEPKCPCYEWPSNVNSPIELGNYESKCPRCKTDLTEEWWDEVHDEELGDWEVEEGGRDKFYRTWYGNCPSCRSYFEFPDYNYDHGESMVGWEPSYIDRAESFSSEMLGNPVRKYEKTALHIHNFDAFKRQSDLLSEETKRLYRLIDTSKSVDESEAIKRAITEVYNAIDILHGGYWDYGAESFATENA